MPPESDGPVLEASVHSNKATASMVAEAFYDPRLRQQQQQRHTHYAQPKQHQPPANWNDCTIHLLSQTSMKPARYPKPARVGNTQDTHTSPMAQS